MGEGGLEKCDKGSVERRRWDEVGSYGKLGGDGVELGRGQDAGVAQVFEFCADGVEGAVDSGFVGHSMRVFA